MLRVNPYKLFSLAFGGNYVKTFQISDVKGIIADYVIGECGAPNTPLPADFLTNVQMSRHAVQLTDDDESRRLTVTADKVVYSERTRSSRDELADTEVEQIRKRAKHLITGVLKFLKSPKQIYFGIVWDYVNSATRERSRFKHPVAEFLAERTCRLGFDSRECITELATKIVFRRELQDSFVLKGQNDYTNTLLGIRDEPINTVWTNEEKNLDKPGANPRRVPLISVDVQRFFDPFRALPADIFEDHWRYSIQSIGQRLSSLLEGFASA